jgi:hypothetical protein
MTLALEALEMLAENCAVLPGNRVVLEGSDRLIDTCVGVVSATFEPQPLMATKDNTHRKPQTFRTIVNLSLSGKKKGAGWKVA